MVVRNQRVALLAGMIVLTGLMLFLPEMSFASYGGSGFESKVDGVTKGLINVLLPMISVLGLVYAAILAASGDAGAKARMVLVIVASIVGFLAPLAIRWLQGIAGSSM